MKGVVCYYRVSSSTQTIEPQRLELQAYCQLRGWTIEHEYHDVISGAKASRKGFNQLMEDAANGKIGAVLVVKIDRLARSVIHFSQIVERFSALNVALIIPGQNIDTRADNPAGRLTMHILASVASFERDLIIERTKAGVASSRATNGPAWGWRKGRSRKDLPVEAVLSHQANGLDLLAACKLEGTSYHGMRKRLAAMRAA